MKGLHLTHLCFSVWFFSGIPIPLRAQSSHPLDPLSATEIKVAVATVRAAGATPEVCFYIAISSGVQMSFV